MPNEGRRVISWSEVRNKLVAAQLRSRGEDLAALEQIEDMLLDMKRCANKLSVSYQRGEVSPRSEFDELINWFPEVT